MNKLIIIKPVSDADFDQLQTFFKAIIHSTYQPLFSAQELAQEMETIPEQFHRIWTQRNYPGTSLTVAWDNTVIVGFIFMRAVDSETVFLDHLFVAPDYRKQGIAQKLQNTALGSISETHPDITTLQLKVYKNNQMALDYYQNRGFISLSESEKRFTMGKKL